jgi:hypothetical protein
VVTLSAAGRNHIALLPQAGGASQLHSDYLCSHKTGQLEHSQQYFWGHLEKVLKKLNYQISKNDIEHIITCTPDIIERVLKVTHSKIKSFMDKGKNPGEKKEIPKEVEFHKINKNQELKDVMSEKDNAIKELKSTVEVLPA